MEVGIVCHFCRSRGILQFITFCYSEAFLNSVVGRRWGGNIVFFFRFSRMTVNSIKQFRPCARQRLQ